MQLHSEYFSLFSMGVEPMALIKCKECGNEVSKKAKECPHCGAPVKQQTSGCAMLFAILGIFGVVGYIGVLISDTSSSGQSSPSGSSRITVKDEPTATAAWVMAQGFVKERLKSPSTADFGSVLGGTYQLPRDHVTRLGEKTFKAVGWVDSQNAFGATVRTDFVVKLEYEGGGQWKLLEEPQFSQR